MMLVGDLVGQRTVRTKIKERAHFPSLALDADLVRRDDVGLELAAPLERRLDALFAIVEVPFRRAHVARDRVSHAEPARLPWPVGVRRGQQEGVRVLSISGLIECAAYFRRIAACLAQLPPS